MTPHEPKCVPAEQVESVTDSDRLEAAACHEAGHAVMRWLVGWPATKLTISDDGSGLCAGTGKRVFVRDLLRVTLAGPVAETSYGVVRLDLERTRTADLDAARVLLARTAGLSLPSYDPDIALRDHFFAVCDELLPYADLVDTIAQHLTETRELSAWSVAAFWSQFLNVHKDVGPLQQIVDVPSTVAVFQTGWLPSESNLPEVADAVEDVLRRRLCVGAGSLVLRS